MKENVYTMIKNYLPKNAQEEQDKNVMLSYIEQFDTILTRENQFAHVTISPWIVNKDFTKVLMVYHNIYQSWSWCGGHVDGEEDFLHVAIQEAKEETGIDVIPYQKEMLAIDILPVIPHWKHNQFVSAHVHLNITYLCIGDDTNKTMVKEDENSDVRWFYIEDVLQHVQEEDMKIVYQKLIYFTKNLKSDV